MSLAIEVDNISEVLLADGWHECEPGSFDLDSYEFFWDEEFIHKGGNSGICATGFVFKDKEGKLIMGPFTSVLAVKCKDLIKRKGGE